MAANNEPADPLAKGTLATAKQAWGDLFRWQQRVVVTNDLGESHTEWQAPPRWRNPISLFMLLGARDWLYFVVGFFAWTADAFDFHALSIQTTKLAKYYDRSKTEITTAITLTLLLRSVGAAIFGLLGDRFGRKWPMVGNMIVLGEFLLLFPFPPFLFPFPVPGWDWYGLFKEGGGLCADEGTTGLLQIATIYSHNFQQFLAVRSLFGLFMGGVYGNAVAMALENCPLDARGLMSGIMQQGYSLGYVLAACANLGVGGATDSWKIVFWAAAGLSIAAGLARCLFPESKQFITAKDSGHHITAADFWKETRAMLKNEWRLCVYCIILMTWFNFYSHTSQDSYTTFMIEQKELDNNAASRASIWMKVGACVGGTIIGETPPPPPSPVPTNVL